MSKLSDKELEQFFKNELSIERKKEIEQLIFSDSAIKKQAEKIKKRVKNKEAKENMLPHSEAKVEMFSEYLGRYLSILTLVSYVDQINIFDVFCGRGFYENNTEGSSIKSYRVIRDVQSRLLQQSKPLKNIALFLNDKNPKFIETISEFINQENKSNPFKINVQYSNFNAVDLIPKVISFLNSRTGKPKNLIFIDPYGYKDIHKKDIEGLLSNGNTEIVLFLPISPMHRFKGHAMKDEANESHQRLREFIEEFFEKNNPIITKEKKVPLHEFINHITVALSFNGNFYSTSFYIERDQSNTYALFFITPNKVGYEKILESKWALDNNQGRGFKLSSPGDMFTQAYTNNFEINLETFLKSGNKTNLEVFDFALEHEHLGKHATKILKEWSKQNRLEVFDILTNEVKKNAYYINEKISKVYFKLK